MLKIRSADLRRIGYRLFAGAGCPEDSARTIVDHLVDVDSSDWDDLLLT